MATSKAADRGREVRQRLLRVAAELIVERGWAAVSTRVLAERAGVAPGVVHYHYASVQALLAEAATGVIRGLVEQVAPAMEQVKTADEALDVMLASLDEYSGTDPTSLLFAEAYLAATRDENLRRSLDEIVADFRRQLAALLTAGGVAAPEATAAVLAAAIDGIMLHRALVPGLTAAEVTPVLRRLLTPADRGRTGSETAGGN